MFRRSEIHRNVTNSFAVSDNLHGSWRRQHGIPSFNTSCFATLNTIMTRSHKKNNVRADMHVLGALL
jgi:hypothetical protein